MTLTLKINWHKSENFGDQLNPYLVKKIWGFDSLKISENSEEYHLMMIGSILNEASPYSLVMGAGFVNSDRSFKGVPRIISVRGNKTLEIIRKTRINYGEICLGDPAILMSDYFDPGLNFKKHNIGIIPHLVDAEKCNRMFKRERGVKIINLRVKEKYGVEEIIRKICSCKCVISSSLHGLIIAHAYGIPGVWCEFSDNVIGNGFKFKDYMSAHNIGEDKIPYINLKNSTKIPLICEIQDIAKNFIVNSECDKNKIKEVIEKTYEIMINNKTRYFLE